MKIAKPLTLGILHKPYRHLGRNRFAIAALGFFRLGGDNERFLSESAQWPLVIPLLPPEQALDDAMPKRYGEALLLGAAHAPDAKPVPEMCVRLRVGAIDKRLHVIGERTWSSGFGRRKASPPQRFTAMPLTYDRAYGGPGHAQNPTGCNHRGLLERRQGRLPNVLYPDGSARTAGFGPLDIRWAPRRDKFGTYGKRWLRDEAPGFASDIDWTVFNLAPPDQWLDGCFEGGEPYRLEGLHPAKPIIEGRLPALRARAFVLAKGALPETATEVPLRFDTVWFLPEHELGVAIHHGQTEIGDSDALDLAAVMVGYESAATPRTLAHYREVLGLRLDPTTAALHAFDESQLAAERSLESEVRRNAENERAQAAALDKQQRLLDELDAEFWEKGGLARPPGHVPPRAEPQPFGTVTAQAVAEGDFDLAGTVAHAKAMAEAVERQGAARLTELKKSAGAAPPADRPAEFAAALERAAVPAYDLFPPSETGRDPLLAARLTALERAWEAGQFVNAADYESARRAVLLEPSLKRQARRAAPHSATPALSAESAQELGRHVLGWHRSAISLAGRDLAGADLRGADFSGADLREVMLEGADLSQAKFAGADMRGAVLTGATVTGADFSKALMAGANLSGSRGERVCFTAAVLAKAQAISAYWPRANLDAANLDGLLAVKIDLTEATLCGAQAQQAVFLQAIADGSVWQHASLDKTIALRASLKRSDFRHARLRKTVVIEAKLQESLWDHAVWNGVQGTGKTDWTGASLIAVQAEGCGLHGGSFVAADFSRASFVRCDFGQCDLRGAVLDDGLFSHSLFMQADLREISARRADFFQALCRKADFRDAVLDGAALAHAETTGAGFGTGGRKQDAPARRAA